MVDPIEIVDKALWASKKIYGVVKSIKDAPEELKALDREVSRVVPVLEHLFETLGKRAQEDDRIRDANALRGLCDEARELIEKADGLLGTNKDGTYKLRKKDWAKWIVKTSNREELTRKFQKLNASIDAYLSYDSHRDMSQFHAKVDDQLEIVADRIDSQFGLLNDLAYTIAQTTNPSKHSRVAL
ncbi:hypothetical protein EIP86_004401 [Pleurotus ostreatoroseus]|nr:hypothetical protein EIP86_004401 [Pleurotus ostreatoroseus]